MAMSLESIKHGVSFAPPKNKRSKRPDLSRRNKENAIHGKSRSSEHIIYSGIIQRCTDKNCKDYKNYGARGVLVCQRWLEPKGIGFINFLSDMGNRPEGMQIDRRDNNGHYNPDNCRWATPKNNCRNRRSSKMISFNGETKCLAQWAEDLGIERKTLQMRIGAWSVERSLTTPYISRKGA